MKNGKRSSWLPPTAERKYRCVSATEITNIIIFCGRTVNFEKCQADGPVRDLYLLLRKLLEKSEWDAEWGRVLLAAYESVRPLKPYERQDLVYRLSYPEKLWKIVNFYYNSGKAWIPEKNQEKLDRLLEQEAARKKFLKLLQR